MALPLIPIAIAGGLYGIGKIKKALSKEESTSTESEESKPGVVGRVVNIAGDIVGSTASGALTVLTTAGKAVYYTADGIMSMELDVPSAFSQNASKSQTLDIYKNEYPIESSLRELILYRENLLDIVKHYKSFMPNDLLKKSVESMSNYSHDSLVKESSEGSGAASYLLLDRISEFISERQTKLKDDVNKLSNCSYDELTKIIHDKSTSGVKRGAATWLLDKQDLEYEKKYYQLSYNRLEEIANDSSDECKKKAAKAILKLKREELEHQKLENEKKMYEEEIERNNELKRKENELRSKYREEFNLLSQQKLTNILQYSSDEIKKEIAGQVLLVKKEELKSKYQKEFNLLSKREVRTILESSSDEIKKEVAGKVLREMEEADR